MNASKQAGQQAGKQASHTPGPWEADGVFVRSPHGVVVSVSSMFNLSEEKANARLIAAAPNLLAACEEALGYLRVCHLSNAAGRLIKEKQAEGALRAAIGIAKAKGQSPEGANIGKAEA